MVLNLNQFYHNILDLISLVFSKELRHYIVIPHELSPTLVSFYVKLSYKSDYRELQL